MKLHPYQLVAVEHLQRNPRSALFLDMGLGKTAATLSALTPDHLPALVVAPKRVAETVWDVEGRLWRPDLSVAVAKGNPKDRARAYGLGRDVTVVGRDNLKDFDPKKIPYRTIILDELSGFKDRSSNRWKIARRLVSSRSVEYVWGLTGTPTPNGLLDLWSQIYLLDTGERLGKTLTGYRGRYFSPGSQLPSGVITSWDLKEGADSKIHSLIDDICLSMSTDGRIELPPVTFNNVRVTLPPPARSAYRSLKKDLVADLSLIGGSVYTAGSAAILSNRLSQLSAGFLYPDPDDPDGVVTWLHREKLRAAEEIVEGTGSPVLMFYRYREERTALLELFGSVAHTLDGDASATVASWNRGEIPLLLAHPASAGHGLNLQHGGSTIVWTSLPWSLEEWEQGNKRVARQGQKNPVVIHTISADHTVDSVLTSSDSPVDDRIAARLVDKAAVQNALLDHLESPL